MKKTSEQSREARCAGTVAETGIHHGALIRGVADPAKFDAAGKSAGVELRYMGDALSPCTKENRIVMAGSRKKEKVEEAEVAEKKVWIVENLGAWWNFKGEEGVNLEVLQEFANNRMMVSSREILDCLGKHDLTLRYRLFAHVDEEKEDWCKGMNGHSHRYPIELGERGDGKVGDWLLLREMYTVRHSCEHARRKEAWTLEEMSELISIAYGDSDVNLEHINACLKYSSTPGMERSKLQKAPRLGAAKTRLPDGTVVDTPLFAMCSAAKLLCSKGDYHATLHKKLRSDVSAFKRAVVTAIEDACCLDVSKVDNQCHVKDMISLMTEALCCDTWDSHFPGKDTVIQLFEFVARMSRTKTAIDFRLCEERQGVRKRKSQIAKVYPPDEETVEVDKETAERLQHMAEMLKMIKSLPGDLIMLDAVAWHARIHGNIPILRRNVELDVLLEETTMPVEHAVDQHTSPPVCYLLPTTFDESRDLKHWFDRMFHDGTGVNPRYGLNDRLFLTPLRAAQDLYYKFATQRGMGIRELPSLGTETVRSPLAAEELSLGVGPVVVDLKKEGGLFLAMLDFSDPNKIRVMYKPSREIKKRVVDGKLTEDLYTMSEEHRTKVTNYIHANRGDIRVKHSHHKELNGLAVRFLHADEVMSQRIRLASNEQHDGGLVCVVGSQSWQCWMEQGISCTVHLHPEAPPPVTMDDMHHLAENCLPFKGQGVAEKAEHGVRQVCGMLGSEALRRLLTHLRNYGTRPNSDALTVEMPTISREGTLHQDDMRAPCVHDLEAFRGLLLLSRLVPGGLRCKANMQSFAIPRLVLFQQLKQWVEEAVAEDDDTTDEAGTATEGPRRGWDTIVVDNAARLLPFQGEAVEQVRQTSRRHHFINMDVGTGKTVTGAQMVRLVLLDNHRVRYVLWTTPRGVVESTVMELKKQGHKATAIGLNKTRDDFSPWSSDCIMVVDHDHLRYVVDKALPRMANTVLVVDECDKLYGHSRRTSVGIELALNSYALFAMTGTAIRNKAEPLATWLNLIFPLPINTRNFYCALAASVSKHAVIPISVKRKVVWVETHWPVIQGCKKLLKDGASWGEMDRLVREATDIHLVNRAIEEARSLTLQPRHSCAEKRDVAIPAGVLLIADSEPHVAKLARELAARGVHVVTDPLSVEPASTEVLVVSKRNARGFNSGVFASTLVTGVYAGNAADREQAIGRLNRLTQTRRKVKLLTVVMQNTISEFLWKRQIATDCENLCIQSMGEQFKAELTEFIDRAQRKRAAEEEGGEEEVAGTMKRPKIL